MAQIETWLKQDIKQLVSVVPLRGNIFSGDNDGNLIGVEVFEDGQPYNMTGNCYGYVIKADNQTEFVPGTVSGNKAQIVLPSICYNVVGPVSIVIKTGVTVTNNVPHGGVTIAACTSYVYRSHTDVVDDATNHILPSYNELADKLEDLEAKLIEAGRVNITQSKTGNVITVTTTDRNGTVVNKTLQEPTVSVTPHDGDFDLNVTDANGSQTVTIPNPNKELSDRAHVETVSRSKTRTGNPIVIEDAVAEIADKTVIKLEPRQDLHGYDKPWIGGSGKNLLKYPYYNTTVTRNGITFTDNGDETITLNGTSTGTTTDFSVVSISNGLPLANGDYILTGILESGTVDSTSISAIYLHAKGDASESGYINFQPDVGAGRERTITIINGSMYNFTLRVGMSGVTFADYKIKLMLRSASNTDASYEPYQNICPITGYDTVTVTNNGSDIFDGALEQGSIDASTGEKSTVSQAKRIRTANQIPLKKGTYTISGDGVQKCYSYRYNLDGSYWGRIGSLDDLPFTFTVDADCKAMFTLYKADNSNFTVADVSSVTIVETASYPIAVSLAEDANHNPAGTVYGGTVTINADGSGTVMVDRARIAMKNLPDDAFSSTVGEPFIRVTTSYIQPTIKLGTTDDTAFISSEFEWCCNGNTSTLRANLKNGQCGGQTTNSIMWFCDDRLANCSTAEEIVATFKNLIAYGHVLYPINTPITYELTANQVETLLGYNYVYTDGAEISLTYRQQILASNDTLLKLLPTGTATGNPAVISDGAEGVPLKNLTVNIEPKQEGTGDPSTSNIRPISGWTAVDVIRANGTDSEEEGYEEKTYSISLPSEAGTVYGGTLTLDQNGEGTLTVDRKAYDMGSAVNYKHATYTSCFGLNVNLYTEWASGIVEGTISSVFPVDLSIDFSYNSSNSYPDNTMFRNSGNKSVYLKCSAYANMTLAEVQTALTGQTIVVPVTPTTYTLTAEQVKTLLGTNYISCDAGEMSVEYFKAITETDLSAYATKEYVDENAALVVTIPVSSGSNSITAFGGTKYGEYKAVAFHGANPGIFSSMTVQTSTSYVSAFGDYNNGISVSCTFASASTAIAVVTIVLQKVSKVRTYTRNGSTYSYTDSTPLSHTTVFDV